MDNFNLRKYLAEGRLLNEAMDASRDKLNQLAMSIGFDEFAKTILMLKDENLLNDIVDAMKMYKVDNVSYYNPDVLKESINLSDYNEDVEKAIDVGIRVGSNFDVEDVMYYVHNNWMAGNLSAEEAMKKISKYISPIRENVAPNLEENEIGSLGKELADEIEDILDKDDKVNEVVDPVSILATVLADTTLTNILSKWVGKIFKKYDFGKGEEAAKKIESFTHRLEKDFKSPIKRVMGLFIKNEKALDVTTDALYAAVILTLGVLAGGGAVQALLKGDLNKGALQTLKAALKGKDLNTLIRDIATNIPG